MARNNPRGRGQTREKQSSVKASRETLFINALNQRGEGIAPREGGGPLYVAGALAGERVQADVRGERADLVQVIDSAPDRQTPPCPHFHHCGGCTLQHMKMSAYHQWKRAQLDHALQLNGVETQIDALVPIEAGSRRRASFAAERRGRDLYFGFHAARSNQVVAITQCMILEPALVAAFDDLRALAAIITPSRGVMKLHVLLSETGLDIRLDDFGDRPSFGVERKLIDQVLKAGFARLSLGDEVLVSAAMPLLHFGTAKVVPPPGGFTQATRKSEAALAHYVCEALQGYKHILDLFAGCGTFTFRLAEKARVHAVEGNEAALAALGKAATAAASLKPVTTERRDLFHRPLMAKELNAFDAILLDPPRVGARAQIEEIARAKPKKIVYVSCLPASFARDSALLIAGGFRLSRVTPFDQFLFSHHVELVGVFEQP